MQNKRPMRVGLLGIYHESNTFLEKQTTREDFENGHLLYGAALLEEYRDAYHEIGGMVEVMDSEPDFEIVPLFYAEATPGGSLSEDVTDFLLAEVRNLLTGSLPLDGLLVVPHGAAVSAVYTDFDGYWLGMAREILGPKLPIIGTIDPHCNLSYEMVAAVNALVAYKTNPHVDQRAVGREAASLLVGALKGQISPTMHAIQCRFAISIEMQHTASSPCKELYQVAKEIAKQSAILSTSIVLGFPYADVPEMGTSFIVIADRVDHAARAGLHKLNEYALENHQKFSGTKMDLDDLPAAMRQAQKPLLLLDMGDNVGGGGPGDSTFLLELLEESPDTNGFMCICDPEAVATIRDSPGSGFISLTIGGKTDRLHGKPQKMAVKLLGMVDGKFSEKEPRHGGQVHFTMGETAIVKTRGGNTLMLTSLRTVPFSLQQLVHFGIDPAQFEILVAKGVQAPLAAYQAVCKSVIRVNTPGVTCADMRQFVYRNRRHPLFPLDVLSFPKGRGAGLPEPAQVKPELLHNWEYYTEGPVVGSEGSVYFTDLLGKHILKYEKGSVSHWADGNRPNGQAILPGGDHLVCDSGSGHVVRYAADGKRIGAVSPERIDGERVHCPNDISLDSGKGFYFSDSVREVGRVYFVGWDGSAHCVAKNLDYPNGLFFLRESQVLWVAESYKNRILKFDLKLPADHPDYRQVFASLPYHPTNRLTGNLPDGLAMDAKERLWVAHYGMQAVQVLSREGKLLATYDSGIPLTSNLCFVDDEVWITGGFSEPGPGSLTKLNVGIEGYPIS
ncbi:M81 family metallopeptidase [Cyclobacterium xiamenense]|uniref:M81 family metallopeptidase n=1 Tax=Cyclobacterium xiamenense TaxID=1297121 RepID=UPI00138706F9|nr:M81 family metallopeptidase [Cyclobacterium xiamenense]